MVNNAIVSIEREKFAFFVNDLIAANWVLSAEISVSDDILVYRFMEIHKIFLRRLGRKEKGIFKKLPSKQLAKIVRGWIQLYRCTLGELRRNFARSPSCRDMIINGINWSDRLNISASGLLVIDHSSRYAEYWAERSVKTKNGYYSLTSRLSFIGSYAYNEYAKMVRDGNILILDNFSNGVTSYDLMLFIRESGCTPVSFLTEIKKMKWNLYSGQKANIERIFEIYANLTDKDLHVIMPD